MPVKKGGQFYLYKTVRVDGVPKSIYGGKLSMQQIQEHHQRKEEQALRKQHQQEIASLLDALDEVRAVNELLIRTNLLFNKQYLRHSEIRRLKHEE